jgi:uncharacterized membrane protein/nitrite reductase/ring-hydroxylating ferredoxin subunit
MKSRANIKGHPIHPILIAFPIALFTGTFIFDVLGLLTGNVVFHTVALYTEAAGILGALAAAIPGFIDFLTTVPPQSSGKKRAARHGISNVINLVVFIVCWFLRRNAGTSLYLITGLELLGMALLFYAGWLGGTLVYRNQIGVDIRYAGAGKWTEVNLEGTATRLEAGSVDDLQVNQMKLLHYKDKRIVLGRTEEGYVAFDDHCTHRGGSLAGGAMICGTVQCPWHGSQFDTKTGAVKAGPAKRDIKTYEVREEGGKVYVSL